MPSPTIEAPTPGTPSEPLVFDPRKQELRPPALTSSPGAEIAWAYLEEDCDSVEKRRSYAGQFVGGGGEQAFHVAQCGGIEMFQAPDIRYVVTRNEEVVLEGTLECTDVERVIDLNGDGLHDVLVSYRDGWAQGLDVRASVIFPADGKVTELGRVYADAVNYDTKACTVRVSVLHFQGSSVLREHFVTPCGSEDWEPTEQPPERYDSEGYGP